MNPANYFAKELRLSREAAGLSQEQFGKEINFSKSLVAMVETCQRLPTREFTVAVDNALGSDGRFERMRHDLLTAEVNPEWFRPWVGYEQEASEIRWYEPLLVPGLLQTEDYARALLGDPDKVAARMDRQAVLENTQATIIVEEGVLNRRIGDASTMVRQLEGLATQTRAAVHVLPLGAETRKSYDGSFALAVVDGTEVGYVDAPVRGFVLTEPGVVSVMRQRWEELATEALPRNLSQTKIKEAIEQWKTEIT